MVERPASITTKLMATLATTGTEGFPNQTHTGPPIVAAAAVVRENILTARIAPLKGAVYTSLYCPSLAVLEHHLLVSRCDAHVRS